MTRQLTTILTLIALSLLLAVAGCSVTEGEAGTTEAVQASESAAHPSSCDGCPQAVVCGQEKTTKTAAADSSAAAGCCPGEAKTACGGQ